MRRVSLLLSVLLLAGAAAGCGAPGGSSSGAFGSSAPAQLQLEQLNVELPRTEDNLKELTAALREFPDALKGALAESGVTVDNVRVTVGTSTSATCQALSGGGVDVAFLPADDYARYGEGIPAILGNGGEHAGESVLICAAPSEYGENLSALIKSGKALTWEELNHAHWGVVDRQSAAGGETDAASVLSLPGSAAANLWLSDHYEGNTLSDLDHVTVYDDDSALTQAAADGKIDVFTLPDSARETYADLLPEIPVLGRTDALFVWVVAVAPGNTRLESRQFAAALEDAVARLCKEDPNRALAFGTDRYAALSNRDLDAMRRLETMNG